MCLTANRNAFGALIADPNTLSRRERVDVVRGLAGALQAHTSIEMRWLGAAIACWLRGEAATLDAALGIEGTPSAAAIVQREYRDIALLRFSNAVGSDARAVRVLRGVEPCPPALIDARDELLLLGAGRSDRSLRRARRRTRDVAVGVRA